MTQNTTANPEWISASDIAKNFGIAKNCVFRMAASGKFPKPLKIGTRVRRWNAQKVRAWIEAQEKECE